MELCHEPRAHGVTDDRVQAAKKEAPKKEKAVKK
jgi:hypothetical protein